MLNGNGHYIKYFKNARLLGTLGITSGLFLTLFMLPMGITITLASAFFIIFREREGISIHTTIKTHQIVHLNLFFFILFIINILILYLGMQHRPLIFFSILSLMFVMLGMESLFYLSDSKLQLYLLLFKIFITSFSIYMSVISTSNSLTGVDIWYHRNVILELIDIGHIPDVGRYSYFPIYHLIISVSSLITNLDFRESAVFSIGFIYSFSLIFVYLLGRILYNNQFGLMSTLLIAFTSYHIQRGYWLIPQSLAISLFLIILYLLIRSMNLNHTLKFKLILIFFIIVLNMTHNLSTLIIFMLFIIFYLCQHFFNIVANDYSCKISNNLIVLNFIIMMFYWTYVYFIYPFLGHVMARKMTLESVQDISYGVSTIVINQLGYFLLIFLSVFGILYALSKKRLSTINYNLMLSSFLFLFLIQILRLINIGAVVPQRWIVFASILLVLPASFGLICMKNINMNHGKILIAMILMSFSFFMITSTVANNDSPIYAKDQTEKFGLSDSEIYSANTMNVKYLGNMSTDFVYYLYFHYNLGNSEITQLNNNSNMIVLRKTLPYNQKYYKVYRNYDLEQYNFINNPNYFKIYESNSVDSYLLSHNGT